MMADPRAIYTGVTWLAVLLYVGATLANVSGVLFRKERLESRSYRAALAALAVQTAAAVYWWQVVGHGPYMAPSEVLSSDSWVLMALFLLFARLYPRVRVASVVVFPATFLLQALALFHDPGIRTLPPTFRSVWLFFHIGFYKVALATIIIASAFSLFILVEGRVRAAWMARLPDRTSMDLHAWRFAGFGFIFWAIAMAAGSIWAYQSWGRFWGWDPVETWSLVTWIVFGIYLHLRRFFGWKEKRAALLYLGCLVLSLLALFYTSHLNTSIHAEYFR